MLSMTGFGKKENSRDNRRVRVEIKTVNHRFLDINIHMPRFLLYLEDDVRKCIQSRLSRGHVEIFINYFSDRNDAKELLVNNSLVSAYYSAAKKLCSEYELIDNLSVVDVLKVPDVMTFEDKDNDEEAIKNLLLDTINDALDEVIVARENEGNKLVKDVFSRLDIISSYVNEIEKLEDKVVFDYKAKMNERIAVLLENKSVLDESRLAQEVAIFADKCNITEETVRIHSHISRFRNTANSSEPQGRNLDFIVQELNREFNTIGSKANYIEITNYVISAKAEIEKVREQIQNIE